MTNDEALRELVKKWRSHARDWRDEQDMEHTLTCEMVKAECADELSALLRLQGGSPAADERLCDFFADVGEVEQFMDDLCNVVSELTGDEGEDDPITVLRRYIDSTGQTSDARDAIDTATCYSIDGDSWFDCPEDSYFVGGRKVGEEFTLEESHWSRPVRFRVTKVPDDVSDDYEVERIGPISKESTR